MRFEKSWNIRAMRKCKSDEIRDRLLEVQKIKKNWNTHFLHTLKPVEHDGKNRFPKY